MKAKIAGDQRRRELFKVYESQRQELKAQLASGGLSPQEREKLRGKLTKMPKNSSRTRIQNRCPLTGRARAVYRYFKLSRIEVRRRGRAGQIPGLAKASW